MDVRRANTSDEDACVRILAALPDYFTPDTHDDLHVRFVHNLAWIALDDAGPQGFVLAEQRYPTGAEILYAAVLPERRNTGIGTALVETCLLELRTAGVRMVEAKTLDASSGYAPYVDTRAFWERRGFVQIDCIDPLPGWDPGNPCAIYVRTLAPERDLPRLTTYDESLVSRPRDRVKER